MDRKPMPFFLSWVLAIATLLASVALFGALYRWDNKYTHPAPQAQNGVLSLTAQNLEEYPIRYLTNGWKIYPGSLLTPQQLTNAEPDFRIAFIGEYGGMQAADSSVSPHGSITYRLTIHIPLKDAEYALELPEIYSSYKLYANGTLVASMGDPDPSTYQPLIQNRIITMHAGGSLDLVLAVTDHSSIYSGMVYPPAFGTLSAVLQTRDLRLLIHTLIISNALFGMLLTLYLGRRSKSRTGLFPCLLYLCLIGITCYPLLHTFFPTTYFPFYPIEISCFSLMLLLVVAFQNKLYDKSGKAAVYALLPCIAGVVISIIYSSFAFTLTAYAMRFFSVVIDIVKYYTAVYLIVTSIYAILRKKPRSVIIFCAGLAFACALLFDRFFPLYEPISGGWFSEIGALILVVAFECVLWLDLTDAYRFRLVYEIKQQQMEQLLEMQKEHYQQLSDQMQQARIASHDLRHHMRTLHELATNKSLASVVRYLGQYAETMDQYEISTFTGNATADAILSYYASLAAQNDIRYDANLNLPVQLDFPDNELCILLGNLLENAMNAVTSQTNADRYIYLRGDIADQKLRLVIDNTFTESSYKVKEKRKGHGLGIQSVQALVKRYGGVSSFSHKNGVFHVSILIPYPPSSSPF